MFKRIPTKVVEGVGLGTGNNYLDFGGNPDLDPDRGRLLGLRGSTIIVRSGLAVC